MKNGITKAAGKEKLSIFFCKSFLLPCGTYRLLFVQRVIGATQARQSEGCESVGWGGGGGKLCVVGEGVADFHMENAGRICY